MGTGDGLRGEAKALMRGGGHHYHHRRLGRRLVDGLVLRRVVCNYDVGLWVLHSWCVLRT